MSLQYAWPTSISDVRYAAAAPAPVTTTQTILLTENGYQRASFANGLLIALSPDNILVLTSPVINPMIYYDPAIIIQSGSSWSSATGLNCFDMTYLDCNTDNIVELNLSGSTSLAYLDCSHNSIGGIFDASTFSSLQTLKCFSNTITTLNIPNNPLLTYFDCNNNKLTGSLDISHMPSMSYFDCNTNNLTTITMPISSSAIFFNAETNILNQTSVDNILASLVNGGQLNGQVLLRTGNAVPNADGYASGSILTARGWGVYTN